MHGGETGRQLEGIVPELSRATSSVHLTVLTAGKRIMWFKACVALCVGWD